MQSLRGGGSPWVPFSIVCAGLFMMLLDATVLNVAQAEMRQSLGASLSGVQWAMDAYLISVTVCLLACGRLGDIAGRRRVFLSGIGLFTLSSALCALAGPAEDALGVNGVALLIGARVLQGVGAAAVLSQSLSLIAVAFPAERRGAAFGMASAIGSLAGVVGPIGGGFLTSHLSWEWIFLINLPIGAAVLAFGRVVPESRDLNASRCVDARAISLSGAALFALTLGLIEAGHRGWGDPAIVALLAGGGLLLALFVRGQRRASNPILRLELFAIPEFRAGNLAMALFNIGFHGLSLPLMVFLQNARGLDPVEAGMVMAPSALAIALTSPFAGRLSDRIGPRWIMAGGFGVMALGVAFLAARVNAETAPIEIAAAMTLVGLGVGFAVSQANAVPMRAVPAHLTGAGSGLLNTTRMAAVTVAVALMASLLQQQSAGRAEETLVNAALSPTTRDAVVMAASEGRFEAIASLGSSAEQATLAGLVDPLREAFASGMAIVLLASVAALVAGVGVSLTLRSPAPARNGLVLEHAPAGD